MPIYASREKKNRKMKTNRHKKWVDSKSIKKNEGYEMVVYNIEMSIYNNNILWTKLIRKNRFIRTQAMQSQFWKKWMDSNNPTGIRVGKTIWNGLLRLGADLYFFSPVEMEPDCWPTQPDDTTSRIRVECWNGVWFKLDFLDLNPYFEQQHSATWFIFLLPLKLWTPVLNI